MQPFEGFLVAPLQIVDHEQNRLWSREHRPRQRLEEALALTILTHWFALRQTWIHAQQFGEDARDLREPYGVESHQMLPKVVTSQPVRHWSQREPPLGGVGARLRSGDGLPAHPES